MDSTAPLPIRPMPMPPPTSARPAPTAPKPWPIVTPPIVFVAPETFVGSTACAKASTGSAATTPRASNPYFMNFVILNPSESDTRNLIAPRGGRSARYSRVRVLVAGGLMVLVLTMMAKLGNEHGGEEHEHERLKEGDEQFQEVDRDGGDHGDHADQPAHIDPTRRGGVLDGKAVHMLANQERQAADG